MPTGVDDTRVNFCKDPKLKKTMVMGRSRTEGGGLLVDGRRSRTEGGGLSVDGRRTHTIYPTKYLLVTGELTTGFDFYGPFDSVEKAGRWATDNLKAGEFHRVHNMYEVRDSK